MRMRSLFCANISSRGKRMKIRFLNTKESSGNLRAVNSLLAVLALVLCSAIGARAQVTTADVRGTVTDEQGAAIAGAEVTITNVETSFSRTVTTGSDGLYNFPELPLGLYKVRATHAGFKSSEQTGITLHANDSAVINVGLRVGAVSESVTAPPLRPTLITALSLAWSVMPVCSELLNPACVARTLYRPSGSSGKLYSPSLPVVTVRLKEVSTFVMVTSAPAIAAPCSSVTVPRTSAVVTCARAPIALQSASASTASSETTTRKLPDDSFVFKNRIFIRLPLEEIFAQKRERIRIQTNCLGVVISFTPLQTGKTTTPKTLPDVMLLY